MNTLKFILDYLLVFAILGFLIFLFAYLIIDMIKSIIKRYNK